MSGLSNRTSTKTVARPAARRAINRISAELDALIDNAPNKQVAFRNTSRRRKADTLNFILATLYAKDIE